MSKIDLDHRLRRAFHFLDPKEAQDALALCNDRFDEVSHPEGAKGARVALIYRLKRDMRWQGEGTERELANIWGVTVKVVRNYMVEATRLFRIGLPDPDEARGLLVRQLEDATLLARNKKKAIVVQVGKDQEEVVEVDDPDPRAMIAGLKEIKDLYNLGAKGQQRGQQDEENLNELLVQYKQWKDESERKRLENERIRKEGIINQELPAGVHPIVEGGTPDDVEAGEWDAEDGSF